MGSRSSIFAFFPLSLAFVTLSFAAVRADDRTMISAATASAVDSLRDDVAAAQIDAHLTVGEFLKATGGNDELLQTLQRAEQLGGPRFTADGGACQIQLQISGQRVTRALLTIAAAHPRQSPVPADVLARMLASWADREFTGVGSSVSGAKLEFLRPPPTLDDAWGDVSDADRRQAVDAARDDAVHHAMDTISPIVLAAGRTVGDDLKNSTFHNDIASWLATRPVRRVSFQADHEVELALSTPPTEFCDAVLAAARAADLPLPDPTAQAALYDQFARLPAVATGHAAALGNAPTTALYAVDLPSVPPPWTQQPLMIDAIADARQTKLKTARAAEADAIASLRSTIEALPLNPGLSIGDAEKKSPDIKRAVSRCLRRVRPYKVDYRADGSVQVKVSLDPRELWAEISQQQ